jgi:hypothetical protein
VSVCSVIVRAVRAGDRTRVPPHATVTGARTSLGLHTSPAGASPSGTCRLPRPRNPTGPAWRIVKVQRGHPPQGDSPLDRGRQTSSEVPGPDGGQPMSPDL